MKNRIMVVRLKSLVIAAAAVVAAMIIGFIIIGAASGGKYKEGSYSSYIVLHNSPVEVCVAVDKNSIKSIELKGVKDEQAVMYPTISAGFDELSKAVIEAQSTSVETDKEYEVAQRIILSAVDKAIEKARNK